MTDRLAAALLARARLVLPALADDARAPALAAIDAFVDRRTPSAYLAATRALAEGARAAARERAAPHTIHRGLEALGRAGVGDELVAALGSLPSDARTGARLEALAALVAAHAELSARAAAATAALRARLRR